MYNLLYVLVTIGFPGGKDKLVNGDLLGAIVYPYVVSFGGTWFYGVMMGLFAFSLWIKSGSLALPVTLGLIVVGVAIDVAGATNRIPGEIVNGAYIIGGTVLGILLYKLLRG